MTTATESKREQLLDFVERVLEPQPAVQAVIGIGSIASGLSRPESDIDTVIFFDPLDWYIVPAEFIWLPSDGTYHSIFTQDSQIRQEGIELDCLRLDLRQWAADDFEWPEPRKAELAAGWLAFDRSGSVAQLIERRAAYPDAMRLARLDEAIVWMDQHLIFKDPLRAWESLGPIIAHDRLQAAYDYLLRALFAYNRHWLPWRNRRVDALLGLPWLPDAFSERLLVAANAPALDLEGYQERAELLRDLFYELLAKLVDDGLYSTAPVDQAFTRTHDEPGYSWNMDDWKAENLRRALAALTDSNDSAGH